MARFSGGPVTHRALTGPRYTSDTRSDEASWKREVLYTLHCIPQIRQKIDHSEMRTVRIAREAGLSWTEIANALGVTRQAAWERWHELDETDAQNGGRHARAAGDEHWPDRATAPPQGGDRLAPGA